MRESMAQLTPRFSADRTVREYTEQHYLPAAKAYLERAANKGIKGKQMIDKLHTLEQKWDLMRFGEVKFETIEKLHKFDVQVYFNDLDPETVKVELFANGINGEAPIVQKMTRGTKIEGTANGYHYNASVTATRPALNYTARAIPYFPNILVPLEISRILWQR
jgi:starch phosphorylase